MKHPILTRIAAISRGFCTLFLLLAASPYILWQGHWGLRPLAILVIPVALVCYLIYGFFQVVGSLCGFVIHQRLSTNAFVNDEGLQLLGQELGTPRMVSWGELQKIRRCYARPFADYPATFKDTPAYDLELCSGERLWVDKVSETELRHHATAHGLTLEGFK